MRRAYPARVIASSSTVRFAERVLPAVSLAVTVSRAVSFSRRASARRNARDACLESFSLSVAFAPAFKSRVALRRRNTLAPRAPRPCPSRRPRRPRSPATVTSTARRPSSSVQRLPLSFTPGVDLVGRDGLRRRSAGPPPGRRARRDHGHGPDHVVADLVRLADVAEGAHGGERPRHGPRPTSTGSAGSSNKPSPKLDVVKPARVVPRDRLP